MRRPVILGIVIAVVFAGCGGDDKPTTPTPTGACCARAGTCTVTTQGNCATPGAWHSEWATCSPNPCPQPQAACCNLLTGSCTVTVQDGCAAPSTWHVEWSTCSPNPCTQPTGSCCAPDGTCTVTTQAACSGTWTLHGVCAPNPCPGPTGACCDTATGACTITTQDACTFTWLGAGVACNTVTCPVPPPTGMVLVPAGTFIMGSPTSELGRQSGETQHEVTLTHAIYVSPYEVTQSEWQTVMGWNTSYFPGVNRPVESVTWYDAVSYCNQRSTLDGFTSAYTIAGATYSGNHITSATVTWNQSANGYRLLTESEWEYACRATSTTAFCNGGITNIDSSPLDPNLDQVGWYGGNSPSETRDVGGKAANAWGLKDMHGNVWEWCWDLYGTYPTGPLTDPTGPASGSTRAYRGGSWFFNARYCRSAVRNYSTPGDNYTILGLRLSRTAP